MADSKTEARKRHRLLELRAENIKRLKAIKISFVKPVTVLAGDNDQGKSSVLDSAMFLFMGKKHPDPELLRRGEEKGFVEGVTENLIIRRTITTGGGGGLTLRGREERVQYSSPQAVLDEATKHCFDPMAFLRKDAKDQAKLLRDLLGLDFSTIDAEIAKEFDARRDVNRDLKQMQALVDAWDFDAEAKEAKDEAPIRTKLEGITAARTEANEAQAAMTEADRKRDNYRDRLSDLKHERQELLAKLAALDERVKLGEEMLADAITRADDAKLKADKAAEKVPDATELLNELEAIRAHNKNVDNTLARAAKLEELAKLKKDSDAATTRIEKLAASKADQLKAAKMPIDGLGFNDTGLTLNDLPFSQASSAIQLRTAIAISAAMQPDFPFMIIKDGSLLDSKSMALIEKFAEEFDLQVLMERVEKDGWATVLIEDASLVEKADADNPPTGQGSLTLES